MNVIKLKHEVCYQTYEVGILHHSFLKNFVEIFLNSIFSSLSLKLKTTLNIKFSKLSIFKTKQGLNGYNLIKISPYISLSVWFCRSWKDLMQPRSRHVLVTSCHDLFNLEIYKWKCVYHIVVDTTHSVTFASPLRRSMYKRSSDWSVDIS